MRDFRRDRSAEQPARRFIAAAVVKLFRVAPNRIQHARREIFGLGPASIDGDRLTIDHFCTGRAKERNGAGNIGDFAKPRGHETVVRIEFRAMGNKTEMALVHGAFTDGYAEHNRGWDGSFDKLEAFLRGAA